MVEAARSRGVENAGAVAAGVPPKPRLLVIDDDKLHRMIICRVAAQAGYIPLGAASYDEAARLAQTSLFDCITLDLSLRQHDGDEMLRSLSAGGCTSPIIIISRSDPAICRETARLAKFLKLNVWESAPKPVDLAALRQSLERLRAHTVRGRP